MVVVKKLTEHFEITNYALNRAGTVINQFSKPNANVATWSYCSYESDVFMKVILKVLPLKVLANLGCMLDFL